MFHYLGEEEQAYFMELFFMLLSVTPQLPQFPPHPAPSPADLQGPLKKKRKNNGTKNSMDYKLADKDTNAIP